jgi:hypothetical protein
MAIAARVAPIKQWRLDFVENVGDFDEVLGFLAGVTNTYRIVAESRGHSALGDYVAPGDVKSVTILTLSHYNT